VIESGRWVLLEIIFKNICAVRINEKWGCFMGGDKKHYHDDAMSIMFNHHVKLKMLALAKTRFSSTIVM